MLRIFRIIFAITFLSFSEDAVAQKKLTNITLTVNPFAFADTESGLTPGVGFGISKNLSIYTDVGFLFNGPYSNKDNNVNLIGYKIKPALRFFFNNKSERNYPKGGFAEIELLAKHVKFTLYDDLRINDNLGNFAYTYRGGYNIIKNVFGANLKIGHRFYFDKERKFGGDIYFGLGLKKRYLKATNLPLGFATRSDFFENKGLNIWRSQNIRDGKTEENLPNFSMGMKLIYRLN